MLIFPTRLSVYRARITHWETQKLSLPPVSKAANSSTSTTLLSISWTKPWDAHQHSILGPCGRTCLPCRPGCRKESAGKGVGEQAPHAHSSIGGIHRHAQVFGLLCSGCSTKKNPECGPLLSNGSTPAQGPSSPRQSPIAYQSAGGCCWCR